MMLGMVTIRRSIILVAPMVLFYSFIVKVVRIPVVFIVVDK